MRKKIALIGGGQIGQILAMLAAQKEMGDIVVIDIPDYVNPVKGQALDLMEMAPHGNYDANITGTGDYKDLEGTDVAIITAGKPRQPGMDRMDLLKANATIVRSVVEQVTRYAPDTYLVVVTNPLDVMTYLALKVSGKRRSEVCGMAGTLDAARLAAFLADRLSVSVKDIQAMVLGGHGDSMVPLPAHTTVAGVPVTEFLSEEELAPIIERTRRAGAEIVGLLQRGSAFYAPSAGAAAMVDSILGDQKRIIPCSVGLSGEYGLSDVCVGVPVRLGAGGVEEVVELELTDAERSALHRSADEVRKGIAALSGLKVL